MFNQEMTAENILGWLTGIAKNKIADFYRSRKESGELQIDPTIREPSPIKATVADVLDAMPLDQRQVLEWKYFDRCSVCEIAERMGRTEKSVEAILYRHYAIPFNTREEFESNWPHIVEVKSPSAPIVLRRAPGFWFGGENGRWFDGKAKTGVCIHTPPEGETPTSGNEIRRDRLEQSIYIELIVDGEIIDLNRIQLPADTPIIDERFKDPESK